MFQKWQWESSSQKEYLGYPLEYPTWHPNFISYIKLNWQYFRRLNAILYPPAIEILCNSNHPMWTLHNLSIMGQWVNNYEWEYFGCSSNCLAPNVTIFTKMQFSGKCINFFTIFFSIYFWGINHTMITNCWYNQEKLTQLFLCSRKWPINPIDFVYKSSLPGSTS